MAINCTKNWDIQTCGIQYNEFLKIRFIAFLFTWDKIFFSLVFMQWIFLNLDVTFRSVKMNANLFYHLRKKTSKNLQIFELLLSKSDFTPLHKINLCNGVKSLLLNKSSKMCRFFDVFFLKCLKRLAFIFTDVNFASRLRKIHCIKRV